MEVDKGDAICLEESASLFFPRLCNIWNHEVETDDNIAKYLCRFFKNSLIVRMSDVEFFCRGSAVAHTNFLAQVDYFSFFWNVGGEEIFLFTVFAREFPWLREIGVREFDSSVKRELSLQKPIHLLIWYDLCDAFFTMFVF